MSSSIIGWSYMVEKRSPDQRDDPACGTDELLGDCRCRPAVRRAFSGMMTSGAGERTAMDVGCRVYRYHHPEVPPIQARDIVQVWVYQGAFH